MDRISRLVGTRPAAMSGRGPGLAPLLFAVALAVLFGVAGLALAGGPTTIESEPDPEGAAERRAIVNERARRIARIEALYQETTASDLEAQLDLERELAARHRNGLAAKHDALLELERAMAMAQRGDDDAASLEARLDLERELAARHRDAAVAERAGLFEKERALAMAQRGGGDAARLEAQLDLERELAARHRDGLAAKHDALLELERAPAMAHEGADRTGAGRGTPESLRRELAERKAAIHELNRELAIQRRHLEETLRELERLEAGEPVGEPKQSDRRKQLY